MRRKSRLRAFAWLALFGVIVSAAAGCRAAPQVSRERPANADVFVAVDGIGKEITLGEFEAWWVSVDLHLEGKANAILDVAARTNPTAVHVPRQLFEVQRPDGTAVPMAATLHERGIHPRIQWLHPRESDLTRISVEEAALSWQTSMSFATALAPGAYRMRLRDEGWKELAAKVSASPAIAVDDRWHEFRLRRHVVSIGHRPSEATLMSKVIDRLAASLPDAEEQDEDQMMFIAIGDLPLVADGYMHSLFRDPVSGAYWIRGAGGISGLQTYWRGPAEADDPCVRDVLEAIFPSRFDAKALPGELIGARVARRETVALAELDVPPGALARVFDEFITMDDLIRRFGPCAYSEASEYLLAGVIEERLLRRFSESRGVEVSDDEIRAASLAGDNRLIERDDPAWADWEDRIRAWKTAKALYEIYGGDVILNFMDQPEPAGAYEEFMKEHERDGSFAILDNAMGDAFWSMYKRRHKPLPADEVDFNRPWWERFDCEAD